MLQHVAVCRSMLQYVAQCCSVCVVREEAIFVLTYGFIFTQIFHVFSEYFTASERVHESACAHKSVRESVCERVCVRESV